MELVNRGLVTYTWGNVSGIDRQGEFVVIKPSGVEYVNLRPMDLVVLDLDGNIIDGTLNPSSDTKTHLELYKAFSNIGGVAHTHSPYAVAWAQAGKHIPCYGTTHADYFYGDVPCVRHLTPIEINDDYEKNTGLAIVECFNEKRINPDHMPAVTCKSHGPFTWGATPTQAVYHAVVLEEVSKMALLTLQVNENAVSMPGWISDKHFNRKHGLNAYYGQDV